MNIGEQIDNDFKKALKGRDKTKSAVLSMLRSSIKNAEIAKMKSLNNEDIQAIISKEIKQRKDSIGHFKAGKRDDLVAKEEGEMKILESYLPEQLKDDEIKKIVQETIDEMGAKDPSYIGRVMGVVMKKVKGKADGAKVKDIVTKILKVSN